MYFEYRGIWSQILYLQWLLSPYTIIFGYLDQVALDPQVAILPGPNRRDRLSRYLCTCPRQMGDTIPIGCSGDLVSRLSNWPYQACYGFLRGV